MKWTVSVVVDRAADEVYAAIADEHELMQWSAWPQATGYTCAVQGDGTSVGSNIVFTDAAGIEQGRQQLVRTEPGKLVEYRLTNRGPRGRTMRPEVGFRIETITAQRTTVHLDFRNDVPLPQPARFLVDRLLGHRVRALHVADLRQLKAFVEQTQR